MSTRCIKSGIHVLGGAKRNRHCSNTDSCKYPIRNSTKRSNDFAFLCPCPLSLAFHILIFSSETTEPI